MQHTNFEEQLYSHNLKQAAQKKAELLNKIDAVEEDISYFQNLQSSMVSPSQQEQGTKTNKKKIKELMLDRKERERRLLQRQEKIVKEMDQQQQQLKEQEKQKELDFIRKVKELHKEKHQKFQQDRQIDEKMQKQCEEEVKKFQGKLPLYIKFEKQFMRKEQQYQKQNQTSKSIQKFDFLESKSRVISKAEKKHQWTPPKIKSHYHDLVTNIQSEEITTKQHKQKVREYQKQLLQDQRYKKLNIDNEKRQAIEEMIQHETLHPLSKIKPLQKYERTYNFREKVYDVNKGEKGNLEVYERNVEDNEAQRKRGLENLQFSKENTKTVTGQDQSSIMRESVQDEKDILKQKNYENEQKQKNLGNEYMRKVLPKRQQIDEIQSHLKKIQNNKRLSSIERKQQIQGQIDKLDNLLKQKESLMQVKGKQMNYGDDQFTELDELLINNIKTKVQFIE